MRIKGLAKISPILALLILWVFVLPGCASPQQPASVAAADFLPSSSEGIVDQADMTDAVSDTNVDSPVPQPALNTTLDLQDVINIAVEAVLAAQAAPTPTPVPAAAQDLQGLIAGAVKAALAAQAAPVPTPIPALDIEAIVASAVQAGLKANQEQTSSHNEPEEASEHDDSHTHVSLGIEDRVTSESFLAEFVGKWKTGPEDQFVGPVGIAVSPSGFVYIADDINNRVHVFTANGVLVNTWGTTGEGAGQLSSPFGIAVSSSGLIYVTEVGNKRVQVLDSNGRHVSEWGVPGTDDGQFRAPVGIAVGPLGRVYVTDAFNNRIQVFTDDGKFLTKWGSHGDENGQFDNPIGIAASPSGIIYVADHDNNRVQAFGREGEFLFAWGSHGSGRGQFNSPFGLTVDRGGKVYVTDAHTGDHSSGGHAEANHRVQAFNAKGDFLTEWGNLGSENGQFSSPFGITVDSTGRIYIADHVNGRVQVFR